MNTIASQEIKRRGISAVDETLKRGPVHVIKSNRPCYVVLAEATFHEMLEAASESRLAASEADLKTGRIRKGTARQLIHEIERGA